MSYGFTAESNLIPQKPIYINVSSKSFQSLQHVIDKQQQEVKTRQLTTGNKQHKPNSKVSDQKLIIAKILD